jgi:hypothetical protein
MSKPQVDPSHASDLTGNQVAETPSLSSLSAYALMPFRVGPERIGLSYALSLKRASRRQQQPRVACGYLGKGKDSGPQGADGSER